MDTEALRIVALDGMDDALLVRLASSNPTLLQLQLLRSTDAVRRFVDPAPPLYHLRRTHDDDGPHDDESTSSSPVTSVYRLLAPRQPSFVWLPGDDATPYRCEYSVDDVVGRGIGSTKRAAKACAASHLLQQLRQ